MVDNLAAILKAAAAVDPSKVADGDSASQIIQHPPAASTLEAHPTTEADDDNETTTSRSIATIDNIASIITPTKRELSHLQRKDSIDNILGAIIGGGSTTNSIVSSSVASMNDEPKLILPASLSSDVLGVVIGGATTNLLPAMSIDDDDDDGPPSLDNDIIHSRKASPRVEQALLSKEDYENTTSKIQRQRQMFKTKSESVTIGTVASPLAAENAHPTSPRSEKRFSVPEVPRWRFVNEAKKTAGYSSSAAGQVVKGLSAQELVGKYHSQKWKAHETTIEDNLNKEEQEAEEVLKEKEERVVGKLDMDTFEQDAIVDESFEGTFNGFHDKVVDDDEEEEVPLVIVKVDERQLSVEEEQPSKEGETLQAPLSDDSEVDSEVEAMKKELAMQVESRASEDALEKEKPLEPITIPSLPVPPPREGVEQEVEIVEHLLADSLDDELDRVERQAPPLSEEETESADTPSKTQTTALLAPQKLEDRFDEAPSPDKEEPLWKRRKRLFLFLLLLVLVVIIAAVVGVMVGGNNESEEEADNSNRAVDEAAVISEGTDSPTNSPITGAPSDATIPDTLAPIATFTPTKAPSSSPTPYCPGNTKLFSISHSNGEDAVVKAEEEELQFMTWVQTAAQNNNQIWQQQEVPTFSMSTDENNMNMTWVVRDVCSGEDVVKCLPCSAHAPSQPSSAASTLTLFDDTTTADDNPPNSTCAPNDRPIPVRNGTRFRFNLVYSNGVSGQCIDQFSHRYAWGLFIMNNDENFGDCAERCVIDVPQSLVFSSDFRGIEYNCNAGECRCLYDEGTLDDDNIVSFDGASLYDYERTDPSSGFFDGSDGGKGQVSGVKEEDGYYCGNLVDQESIRQRLLQPTLPSGTVTKYSASEEGVSGCLPEDKEYVLEVRAFIDAEEGCCGFTPESYVAMFDNIALRRGGWPQGKPAGKRAVKQTNKSDEDDAGGRHRSLARSSKTYFGEVSEPCKTSIPSSSSPPSTMPSTHPTITGTYKPTTGPVPPLVGIPADTSSDNLCREVIKSEMAGRIAGLNCKWCGFCNWKLTNFNCYQRMQFLINSYGTGHVDGRQALCDRNQCVVPEDGVPDDVQRQIDSVSVCGDVPVIEEPEPAVTFKVASTVPPTKQPTTEQPTPEPSFLPSSHPSEEPHSNPSSSPTTPPTQQPSLTPTMLPTLSLVPTSSPTEKPTCDESYDDFNMCIAIDTSGSVCNQGTGNYCIACEPDEICNDIGMDKATCCNNFLDVVEFAKNMVIALESIPNTNQSYSVVGFSTNATTVDGETLTTPDLALEALDRLIYTGGKTNHADAMNACRESIASSPLGNLDRTNVILLITDGAPSEPAGLPQDAAEEAADAAKADGVFIIPVYIVPKFTAYIPSPYLHGISSDGVVFDVDDFTILDSLRGSLLDKVSCQV